MKIHLTIWDSDSGTGIQHYWSEQNRTAALYQDLLPHWDEAHGTAPDNVDDLWEQISKSADFWFIMLEIDTEKPDTAGVLLNS